MAGKQKYNTEEIAEALKIIDANDGNIQEAQRITGISRATLTRWKTGYNQKVAIRARKSKEEKLTKTLENVHEVVLVQEGELEIKAMKAREILLNRIIEMAPQEKNMDRLTNALKLMHTISTGNDPDEPKGNSLTIFQQVQQQLINMNNNG